MLDDDFDFGFSSTNIEEIKLPELMINEKAEKIYNSIMPLLNNLMKDADTNDYIHWPNRKEKIEKFINKLDSIMSEK